MNVGKLHIDMDLFIYRVGFVTEEETLGHAYSTMDRVIGAVLLAYPEIPYQMYLSGSSAENYRHEFAISHPYKGNRKSDKPKWYHELRKYVMDEYDCDMSTNNEADDTVSIAFTTEYKAFLKLADTTAPQPCVVSVDKDFDQLRGIRYDFIKEVEVVKSRREGDLNLYRQVMEGDTADNIKGIFGVGKKKATALLKDCQTPREMYDVCVAAWIDKYECPEEDAVKRVEENLNLLFLQREKDVYWKRPEE